MSCSAVPNTDGVATNQFQAATPLPTAIANQNSRPLQSDQPISNTDAFVVLALAVILTIMFSFTGVLAIIGTCFTISAVLRAQEVS